jgi:hypothetical protein
MIYPKFIPMRPIGPAIGFLRRTVPVLSRVLKSAIDPLVGHVNELT